MVTLLAWSFKNVSVTTYSPPDFLIILQIWCTDMVLKRKIAVDYWDILWHIEKNAIDVES